MRVCKMDARVKWKCRTKGDPKQFEGKEKEYAS